MALLWIMQKDVLSKSRSTFQFHKITEAMQIWDILSNTTIWKEHQHSTCLNCLCKLTQENYFVFVGGVVWCGVMWCCRLFVVCCVVVCTSLLVSLHLLSMILLKSNLVHLSTKLKNSQIYHFKAHRHPWSFLIPMKEILVYPSSKSLPVFTWSVLQKDRN